LTKKKCFRRLQQRFCGRFAPSSWDETSTGRIVYGANRPWGDSSSVGRNAACPWGETSMGESPMKRNV